MSDRKTEGAVHITQKNDFHVVVMKFLILFKNIKKK